MEHTQTSPEKSAAQQASASSQSCPCCFFIRPGLFLPPDEYTLKSSSCNEKDSNYDEPRNAVVDPREAMEVILASESSEGSADDVTTLYENSHLLSSSTCTIRMADMHGHAHLNRERQSEYAVYESSCNSSPLVSSQKMISITCSVEEEDWEDALLYASKSPLILPALGVHPWYLHNLADGWLDRLEYLLLRHPSALVGEIGLCKMAQNIRTAENKEVAMQRQKKAFKDQMILAAKLKRPVSVHCVRQHGCFLEVLKEMRMPSNHLSGVHEEEKVIDTNAAEESDTKRHRNSLPPCIAMHSFTGTCQHVRELLLFEESLVAGNSTKKDGHPRKLNKKNGAPPITKQSQTKKRSGSFASASPLFYFGFSHSINVLMCSSDKAKQQGYKAIRAVPIHRLLVESDVHSPADVAIGTAGAIALLSDALQIPLTEVARITTRNALEFLRAIDLRWETERF